MDKFKMVPVEPTEEMLKAWLDTTAKTISWKAGYKAMLEMAPTQAFDEAAEREEFEANWSVICRMSCHENLNAFKVDHYGAYVQPDTHIAWISWIACARLKAGVTGHE